jgi:predicted transcriptional regulator
VRYDNEPVQAKGSSGEGFFKGIWGGVGLSLLAPVLTFARFCRFRGQDRAVERAGEVQIAVIARGGDRSTLQKFETSSRIATDHAQSPREKKGGGEMAGDQTPQRLTLLTARIVGGYLRHHRVSAAEVGGVIASVHASLRDLGKPAPPPQVRSPAVPVRQSVRPEYVVCLECGFRAQMLRRHLRAAHGLTPVEYRARWSLPKDHPVIAPAYSHRRSAVARAAGLGRRQAPPAAAPPPEPPPAPKRRGRSRAAATSTP